jgi:Na+-translocating ferredoxin:NAD+ oxidoreductase subunit E
LKSIIPVKVRILTYVVVIATFVSAVEMFIHAYFPSLHESLGIFIPLIVVNCIILGRAEAFAAKNSVYKSALDGLGMGLGFTFALTLLGVSRELLGTGKAFGFVVFPDQYGALIFVLAPGAFIVLGYLIVVMNKVKSL